ncbi:MAG TPA: 2-hydroxychromene-2-carboxylate isomerase [Aliidongia sp.]|uniref:2-hydroxychromene-2-carboxylate isomerase n=1 Tax=Aliidongia sp. TaxID=1914230 RepID=UPI002DDD5649|nr:2-hydroxychromene-2-carboxylate isomerase [Aliidongia sp.]HEV2673572.1 2-hydroxychromene-2-carboxylate isomerase [Aliidongia sp.]
MTTTGTVEYYFTPVSPWAYLGHTRFLAIAAATGATIEYKPADYGRIFAISGGLPLAKRAPQRQAYRQFELKRWSALLGLPLNPHPKYFPVPADLAARVIVAATQAEGDVGRLTADIMRAVWTEERNVSDAATLAAVADAAGFDGAKLLAAAETDAVTAAYGAHTEDAIAAQVFGAPTYIHRGEPFWGQDRLDFLERALRAG